MNSETWDNRCHQGILGLFLAILVFSALAFGGVGAWEFLGIQVMAIGVLVLWAIRVWASPKPRFLWPPITWFALAFAAYAIGRYLTCDIEYAGRLEFIQVVVFTLLFLAVINNLFHQEMTLTISFTLIILAMATASYAVAQYLTGSNHIWLVVTENPGRVSGTFMSPDHFCGYLEMILPLVLSLLLVGRIQALTRVLLVYCFLIIVGGAALTFSRAGWIAMTAGVLLVLLVLVGHRNHRKAAALVLLLLAGGGTVFVTCFLSKTAAYLARVADAQGKVNLDAFVREKVWHDARRMWLDHFWWGVGPGNFDWRYDQYRSQAVQMRPGWPHCDYLNLLTDWGLVGGLIVAVAIVAVLWGLYRTWPRVRRAEKDLGSGLSNRFAIFLGAAGGLAAIAVHSLVDFSLHVPADDLVALTLLGLLSSNLRFATERFWQKIRLPSKLMATVVLLTATGYLGWQTYRLGHEAWWLAQAAKFPANTLYQSKLREKAFQFEPMNFENAYYIGEGYRNAGLQDPDLESEATSLATSLEWYQRSEKLNPYYNLPCLRAGQYYDLLGQTDTAWQCYDQADRIDPNGYFTAANIGFHFLHLGQYAAARPWLTRSLLLGPRYNPVASGSMELVEQELSNAAGNLP